MRGGGRDGGVGELEPKEEKKSELREGGGGEVSASESGAMRDGGVNHEMGELKMSFLLRPFSCDGLD